MKKKNQKIKINWLQNNCSQEEIDFRLKEAFKILISENEILEFMIKEQKVN